MDYIRNALKETLQLYILQYLSQSFLSDNLVFKGRACLRIFIGLPYLSEKLDFDWVGTSEFDIDDLASSIKNHFISVLKFDCFETKIDSNYHTIDIEFPVLDLIGLSLAPSDSNKLHVRLNITPAKGTSFTTEPGVKSTRDFSFVLRRLSLPDLMASNIADILTYEKDQDYFDLAWFLENKETPNWKYLQELTGLTKKKAVDAIKTKIAVTAYDQSAVQYNV
jgi:predicted nucleotidyltransferase component of viral defense system